MVFSMSFYRVFLRKPLVIQRKLKQRRIYQSVGAMISKERVRVDGDIYLRMTVYTALASNETGPDWTCVFLIIMDLIFLML